MNVTTPASGVAAADVVDQTARGWKSTPTRRKSELKATRDCSAQMLEAFEAAWRRQHGGVPATPDTAALSCGVNPEQGVPVAGPDGDERGVETGVDDSIKDCGEAGLGSPQSVLADVTNELTVGPTPRVRGALELVAERRAGMGAITGRSCKSTMAHNGIKIKTKRIYDIWNLRPLWEPG